MSDIPFLKPRKMVAMLIAKRNDKGSMEEHPADEMSEHLKSAAADLLRAIEARDVDMTASALKAAFEMLDSDDDSSEVKQ